MEKTKETLRTTALAWWNNLPQGTFYEENTKNGFCEKYYSNRTSLSLTGREIEEIWLKETEHGKQVQVFNEFMKPNQKQFTEFSEAHFWKYFNKFKHQDKVKMYELLKSWYNVEGDKIY